ncbi:hypothetical protein E1264_07040 [Actinomadura sp. KC216]|uniref:hypothetical protein n=1 Tax=Actinomadura sp. KC216 TaxID=2530370 RepID=UPI001047C877|nr:hypothetical protein [Actinomadura sp. KC216]TDB89849.1 hypothetical protein E1264_07040 [Actinomadura sp. KC216]
MRPDDLTAPEEALWEAVCGGDPLDLSTGRMEDGDPAGGDGWGLDRTIRAKVIRTLLLGVDETPRGGVVPALRLAGARIDGCLDLAHSEVSMAVFFDGCAFTDPPDLTWARTRAVELTRCRLPGFVARFARMDANLVVRSCGIDGWSDLFGAHVSGQLDLQGTCLSRPGDVALTGDGLAVDSGMLCGGGFSAEGEVSLVGARVGAILDLRQARLSTPGGQALNADRITIDGALMCSAGFAAEGEIWLRGAHIAGDLTLSGASLRNEKGRVLDAGHLKVDGGLFAVGIATEGEIKLHSARVGGPLSFIDARLSNPGGTALLAEDGLTVGASTFFGRAEVAGEICLLRANIGGLLSLTGTRLANPGRRALQLHGLTVESGLHLGGATIEGEVGMIQARIGDWLYLRDARLSNPGAAALVCPGTSMHLLVLHTRERIEGSVDLTGARIERIDDDLLSWPDRVRLDGLTYDTLAEPGPVDPRLQWIGRDRAFVPQPYEQLAAAYRRLGDDAAARSVLLAKYRRHRGNLAWYAKAWGLLQDVTVGYGYRPARAAGWLLALLVTGTVAFASHHPPPVNPGGQSAFNPFIYTLDVLLPVINFGFETAYRPDGLWQWLTFALTASGWILATAIIAGITRTVIRQ